jgi:uncharacterized protein
MGPLAKIYMWGPELGLAAAFVLGIGFGAALEMGGLGNSKKLALQFYFKDLTVFKVMFTGIVVAMLLTFGAGALGWMDLTQLYLNPTYLVAQTVGGFIVGIGFVIGGY